MGDEAITALAGIQGIDEPMDLGDLGTHAVVFVVMNAMFVGIWALTGGGYFWPAWIIGFWGVGRGSSSWGSSCGR